MKINKLLCLCLTFTSFFKESLSCNNNQILDNRYLNCSDPLILDTNCWYDFHITNNVPLCLKINRETNTSKIFVKWEDVFNYFDIFLSWNSVPVMNSETKSINFHGHVPSARADGYVSYTKDVFKKDIYNCDRNISHCVFQDDNKYENTGELFISMYSSKSSGIINFGFEEPNRYIKPEQLNFIKELFNDCCRPEYKFTPPAVSGNMDILKTGCEWKISENLFKLGKINKSTNYGLDLIDTNSCEDLYGILCDKDGNIIKISLSNMILNGKIPESIKTLTKLEILFLPFNNLTMEASVLSDFKFLKEIDINGNNFYGNLPCFNKDIVHISISSNIITGIIPECISQLDKINFLDLSRNPFSKQKMPYIPKIVSYLILSQCNIYGKIYMKNNIHFMKHLDLSSNFLSGEIPYYIFNPYLNHIDLSSNFLSGNLPTHSHNLVYANFNNNNLNGNLVNYTKNLNINSFTDISFNNFTGILSKKLIPLLVLRKIIINGNKFLCDPITKTWPKWVFFIKNLGHCYNNNKTNNIIISPTHSPTRCNNFINNSTENLQNECNYNTNNLVGAHIVITIFSTLFFVVICYSIYYRFYNYKKQPKYSIKIPSNERSGDDLENQELIEV